MAGNASPPPLMLRPGPLSGAGGDCSAEFACAATLAQVLLAAPRMLGDLIAELPGSTLPDSILDVLQPFAAARLLRLSPNVAAGQVRCLCRDQTPSHLYETGQ